jgi:transcriptional regulator with XRE-family HTH domain
MKRCDEIHLGRHLRDWRLRQGLSQEGAARKLGVAASTWGHWETGARLPTPRLLLLLREMTGMSIGYLMCENSENCPHQRQLDPYPE